MERTVSVYVPPTSMAVVTSSSDDTVTISCSADNMFPAPELSLSWTEQSVTQTSPSTPSITESAGLYSASLTATVPKDSVGRQDLAVCLLSFPGTQYFRREETEMLEDQIPEKFLQMLAGDAASQPEN